MLYTLLVIILLLAVVGALPGVGLFPATNFAGGYAPSGIGFILLIIVIVLLFRGGL